MTWRRSERGSAAVEFAIVLPLLLVLVAGAIQFGLLFHTRMSLQSAAREGARLAAISGATAAQITDRVRNSLSGVDLGTESCPAAEDGYCIAVAPAVNQPCFERPGEEVTVEVTSPHAVEIPFIGSTSVALVGKAVFRCE